MYSKRGAVVAIIMTAFPFLALGYEMGLNSLLGIGVYAGIVIVLVATLLFGSRIKLAPNPEDQGASQK